MTDPTMPKRSHKKQPPPRVPTVRPARDTLILDNESFSSMCRALLNFSEELAGIASSLAEIRLQNFTVCSNQEALSGDIANIISRLAILEQLAQIPPAPPPSVYRPQYDHQGQPLQPPRQLPPRPDTGQPPPLREVLRGMQGVQPRKPQQQSPGFYPDNTERRK